MFSGNGNTRHNKQLGNIGENAAVELLSDSGFEIIERNFRYGKTGEIDIIAEKNNLIVFVEVKSRNSSVYGGALYAITERKIMTLKKVARYFLHTHPEFFSKEKTYRFDLIAIQDGAINWVEDIGR